MALSVRNVEEVKILKEEMGTLTITPVDMIAHKLGVHYATAEHLRAMIKSEIKSWVGH